MTFRIFALPMAPFTPLFALDNETLAGRGARRVTADAKPGFPCRVSLVDATPGETLILAHWEHQNADSPFRASHALYVRERAEQAHLAIGEVPELLRLRTLSLRGFDAAGMLVTADLAEGRALEPALETMLGMPEVAYVHLHYAKPGCYAARADRA